jgi:hypothetical protein
LIWRDFKVAAEMARFTEEGKQKLEKDPQKSLWATF